MLQTNICAIKLIHLQLLYQEPVFLNGMETIEKTLNRKLYTNFTPKHNGKNYCKQDQPNNGRGKLYLGRIVWIYNIQKHGTSTYRNNFDLINENFYLGIPLKRLGLKRAPPNFCLFKIEFSFGNWEPKG